MDRRTILKGGIAFAATAQTAAASAVGSDNSPELTWEEVAAIDFEPWRSDLLEILPDNEEWKMALVTVRLASVVLTRSKPEVIEAMAAMGKAQTEEGENVAVRFIEGLTSTRDILEAALAIADAAIARSASGALNA